MRLDDVMHNGQPQANARGFPTQFAAAAIKTLEDQRLFFGGNTRSLVTDR